MSVGSNIVGQTYAASQVSTGNATLDVDHYIYNELATSPLGGTATVTSFNTATNAITFTVSASGLTAQGMGTVIGNDANSVLISGSINVPFFGTEVGIVYLTNTPGEQPGVGGSFNVPIEPGTVVYTPACYCRGTRIRTPDGLREVESLAEGDLVQCLNGGTAAVRWIGRRSYAGRFLRANPQLRPVRFRAGSLGPATPSRDLLVSPRHAMLIDGALVPAELLVNGTTITAGAGGDTVDYFHIELPGHDAVWAEDALSETFVDDGSRGVFHNAHPFPPATAGRAGRKAVFFAPRVEGGEQLARIRAALAHQEMDQAA